jgi:hypothetical protein
MAADTMSSHGDGVGKLHQLPSGSQLEWFSETYLHRADTFEQVKTAVLDAIEMPRDFLCEEFEGLVDCYQMDSITGRTPPPIMNTATRWTAHRKPSPARQVDQLVDTEPNFQRLLTSGGGRKVQDHNTGRSGFA